MLKAYSLDHNYFPRREVEILLPEKMVERRQAAFVLKRLEIPGVEVLVGPSRSGKTTFLFQLMQELQFRRQVSSQKMIYINFDEQGGERVLMDVSRFVENLGLATAHDEPRYVFIDNVHLAKGAGVFLSDLAKRPLSLRLVATSLCSLKGELVATDDAVRETVVYPLNLVEWAGCHDASLVTQIRRQVYRVSLAEAVHEIKRLPLSQGVILRDIFFEMATFGGHADVLLAQRDARWSLLSGIFQDYLAHKVLPKGTVDRPLLLAELLKLLARQVGFLCNNADLAVRLGASQITTRKYLELLAATMVLKLVEPLSGKKKSEVSRARQVYFVDAGLWHEIYGQRQENIFAITSEAIKNAVFSEIIKNLNAQNQILFWQTNTGTAVDFVVKTAAKSLVPVAVWPGQLRPGRLSRSLRSFIATYKPQRAFLVNESLVDYQKVGETEVISLPYHWFCVLEGLWQ